MDWWSTSDPDEIERFMNTVKQSTTFGDPTSTKYHEDFDLNNWDRATDSQFSRGKLSYDDFNERFLVSVPGINGEELICYGFYVPAIFVDGSIVGIDTGMRNWHARRSGALTNIYPEFDLLLLSRLLYSGASAVVSEDVAVNTGMTDLQLVTRAAQKAEAAIGGKGGVAGTLKHTYAKNLLSRYQSIYGDRGFSLGSNYFNNNALYGPGNKGFLDIINKQTMTIYDFKFGNAVMSNAQYLKYSNNFPGYSIQIIRP